MTVPEYRKLSLWHESVAKRHPFTPRPALRGEVEADVVIVGAGFTGLWTAYYLLGADPTLRVVVLEAEIAGFGASGRNGGWCSALFPVLAPALAREYGEAAATSQYSAMRESMAEVVRVASAEGIEADIVVGGAVTLARSGPQLERARKSVAEAERFGLGEQLLSGTDARHRVNAIGVIGGTFNPHCAVVQPAKLVSGLAEAVERRGGRIFEQTPVLRVEKGHAHVAWGVVHADVVVRATEGYTGRISKLRRVTAPVYSQMIATEPLRERIWRQIGMARREVFSDYRHLIIYGQRTSGNRLVLGGRGAPYHFGSSTAARNDRHRPTSKALRRELVELFPVLADTPITHEWGGPIGVNRDWHASVGLADGIGWAGGYVGDGVSTTNLAGRTLRDLILHEATELTTLPWVGHRSRRWAPEPVRWLEIRAGVAAMRLADHREARSGRASRLAALMARATGE